MRKRMQKIFLLGAILCISLGYLGAVVWTNGDVVRNGGAPGSVWDTDLTMDGDITVSEDVYIGARKSDVTVNLSGATTIKPAADSGQHEWGHLIFFAGLRDGTVDEACGDCGNQHEITINVDYDLVFSGVYSYTTDLIVTFSGPGRTRFKLRDYNPDAIGRGVNVTFDGYSVGDPAEEIYKGSTRVYILMDQTEEQAMTNGCNKVIFERHNYSVDSAYPYTGQSTGVIVGPGSFITYLSTNPTGHVGSGSPYSESYGSLAFDPTFGEVENKGRLFLEIKGDPASSIIAPEQDFRVNGRYNFHDGGVIVCGHYVPEYTEEAIRTQVYLNATAGIRALFRVIDCQAYAYGTRSEFLPQSTDRRGLLVINENTTVAALASDPYQTYGLWDALNTDGTHPAAPDYWSQYYSWYNAPYNQWATNIWPTNASSAPIPYNVRTGFVLGTNGWMDIYPNTFFDHVACNYGELNYFASEDYSSYLTGAYDTWADGSPYFKWRNPAAFVIDGLNYYSNTNDYKVYVEQNSRGDVGTIYNDPSGTYYTYDPTLHAHIIFYGDSRAYFRCACGSDGIVQNFGPFDDGGTGVYEYQFWADLGAYDGNYVPGSGFGVITPGEGEGVLDVEGLVSCYTRAWNEAPGRSLYSSSVLEGKGILSMPTLEVNFMGNEAIFSNSNWETSAPRPLVLNDTYWIMNSPHMNLNERMNLYDVRVEHVDVTKLLTTDPQTTPPAIVGGEAVFFNQTIWPAYSTDSYLFEQYDYPKMAFYNSELNMHESLVSSGVRFIATEINTDMKGETIYGDTANNSSVFRFYDHGDKLDTMIRGYGRLFMVGSGANHMSAADDSGYYSNYITEAGYINVFRNRKITAPNTPPTLIKLGVEARDDASDPTDLKTGLLNDDEYGWNRAHHLFLLSRSDISDSYMSLGWTATIGSDFYYPWEALALINSSPQYHFEINAAAATPATFSVDGNYIYFGGTDWDNNKAVVPVIATGEPSSKKGSIIYTDHGGRFTATQPDITTFDTSQHGYDCFVDTVIAYRLWGTEDYYGIIDLPKDQVIYGHGFGRQPYDINSTSSLSYLPETGKYGLRVRTYNTSAVTTAPRTSQLVGQYSKYYALDQYSGEEVVVPWGRQSHTYDSNFWPNTPAKLFARNNLPLRYTAMIDEPPGFPDHMLYFGANDYITQLKISGATMADPINMLVSGNLASPGYARIREIVSIPTNPGIPGEGAHALIFLNRGGRIGLGNREWNEHSVNAWNLLGKDYVTIAADGDGVVDLNSNVLVTDNGAIVATENFGADPAEYGSDESPRLSIFSEESREIRVPRGVELDLSTFAKQLGTDPQQQIIEIGGRVKLIFEPGSKLRFPKIPLGDTTPRPILYLNDEAELIFEEDLEEDKGRYADVTSTDSLKTLILGCGQIWVNKDAKILVSDNAMVAVQSDPRTPITNLTVSIQRQGQFLIGTGLNAGGSFEVGNPVNMDNYFNESGLPHPINFELVINGPKARFHIDREGFFGLGVGIVNKSGIPTSNGPSADPILNPATDGTFTPANDAWEVQALFNVHNVAIRVIDGIFDHSNIFDGTSRRASLMAVGPVYAYAEEEESELLVPGSYAFEIQNNPDSPVTTQKARVLGGGNIMKLAPKDLEYPGKALVNIWSYADESNRTDGTMYNILASYPIILRADLDTTEFPLSVIGDTGIAGRAFEGDTTASASNFDDFFRYISYPDYDSQSFKNVIFGEDDGLYVAAYVRDTKIFRDYSVSGHIRGGLPSEAVNQGSVMGDQDGPGQLTYSLKKEGN